ncbi:MAG: hypothetical protein ACREEM_38730 [Blastocatellia bacterium]
MTKKRLQKLVEKNLRKNPSPMIDTETGLEALESVVALAESSDIAYALVGGIAMHLYGSPRLTKDVDVIASAVLPLKPVRPLGFGGERYQVKVGKRAVPIDWIVRSDTARKFYESALADAYQSPSGLPIVTPEWLIVLKYIAGRSKDQQDAVYLLKQKGLVDRRQVRRNIIAVAGREFWALVSAGLKRWYDLADGRITTEKDDYEADRI